MPFFLIDLFSFSGSLNASLSQLPIVNVCAQSRGSFVVVDYDDSEGDGDGDGGGDDNWT